MLYGRRGAVPVSNFAEFFSGNTYLIFDSERILLQSHRAHGARPFEHLKVDLRPKKVGSAPKNGQSRYWISFALRKGQRRPRNDPDGPDMDHPRRSSPAHIPWGPYGQLGWVVVTCACDPLPSRRPKPLKRARTGGSGRRLSGSLAGDSGDHHQYQRRGIVSCDVY